MENKVFTYLEFALPIHNCVIIPELGGFIVNQEEPLHHIDANVCVPGYMITFNPDLKHDDGVIVSYYIRDGKMTYNAALQKIKDFVKGLKQELSTQKPVTCGRLGSLYMNKEGKLLFEANPSFVFPSLYGLTAVGLSNLSDINRRESASRKSFPIKYTLGSVAAALVAMFLFTVPSANVSNNTGLQGAIPQQSGFIYSLAEQVKPLLEVDSVKVVEAKAESKVSEAQPQSLRTYYIIVGGEDTQSRAERLLDKIKKNGLQSVNILEAGGRFRIYVASFSDKPEAEGFLDTFRKENPKYETAWLYSKRN